MGRASWVLVVGLLWMLAASTVVGNHTKTVTYDKRSLIIGGAREIFFSGSIHYPRMPTEVWPDILRKAKEGGLNVIQTYIFWNVHEPVQGQFNFEGNNDVVKFIRMIGDMGMYVTLRVGPYLEAEWNLGGFPYWMKEVPNIIFRSYNEPFMNHMKKFVVMVIDMMKKEKLFAPQGGPIIMAQIENEYSNVAASYRELGVKYIHWAAELAVGLYNEVPWIMCKQKEAPNSVINTCNGRQCGDTFSGPNGPNKPFMWTENWTAQYRVFGDPPSQRSAEDLAFSVTRFYAKNGTYVNYYMYFGGNNYGRTGSSFVSTGYYDEGPLDQYGLYRDPKWSHLRDCHRALKLSKKPLLWGSPTVKKISTDLEIITFENTNLKLCAAFLTNNNTAKPNSINFRGTEYYLPARSISLLPDCKNVIFNTQNVVSQHNARNFVPSKVAANLKWEMFHESIPKHDSLSLKFQSPLELYTLTKDTTDYAWYSTRITLNKRDLPMRSDILPVLEIRSRGHALLAFVNGEYVGSNHGTNIEKGFDFRMPVNMKPGDNEITILHVLVGFPNSGAYMEKRFAGLKRVVLQGLMSGTLDITLNSWTHSVGVSGEKLKLFTEEGSEKVKWSPAGKVHPPLTWYKTYFDVPEGNDPVAVRMNNMAKGIVWINGKGIGRYWVAFLSPLGQPTQSEYHIPRSYLKPKNNLMVVFEEIGGDPQGVEVMLVNRDTICSYISEYYPSNVKSWERKGDEFKSVSDDLKPTVRLSCPDDKVMKKIEFAEYGDPEGVCGNYFPGNCTFPNANKIVEKACLGKSQCKIPVDKSLFEEGGKDLCPNIYKSLAVQAKCGRQGKDD
nr:beta-galactosidase 13-like [Ipomoea batatas]